MTTADLLLVALSALAVLVGTVLQRVTGSGVGAVGGPPLILLLGPVAGVQVLHVVAAVCSVMLLVNLWRDVDWTRATVLTLTAIIATPIGVLLAFTLPEPVLQIAVGLVMLAALFTVEPLARTRLMRSRLGIVATGVLGGVANGTVGQAGPLMAAYAVASRWALPGFVASMQVCWLVVNVVAAVMKGVPPVAPEVGAVLLGALAAGWAVSIPVARALPRRTATRILVVVAVAGSAVLLAKGLWALVAALVLAGQPGMT